MRLSVLSRSQAITAFCSMVIAACAAIPAFSSAASPLVIEVPRMHGESAVAGVAARVTASVMAILPSRRGEKHAEVARFIGPAVDFAEARAPQQRDEIVRLVLVGILGMDAFAGPE